MHRRIGAPTPLACREDERNSEIILQYPTYILVLKIIWCVQTLRDGILRVGSSMASKLEGEPEVDEWFQCIGDSQNSDLLKLYAKVSLTDVP